MCDEWRNNFSAFIAHIGRRPGKGYSLGRIDNNKGYEPGNVRWETIGEQNNNMQKTVWITDPQDGKRLSMANFCRKHRVPYRYFRDRYTGRRLGKNKRPKYPWPIEKILAKAKILFPNFIPV